MLRFKDTIKDVLKRGEVLDYWTESVDKRPAEWHKLIHEVCSGIDKKRWENKEWMRGEETPKKIDIFISFHLKFHLNTKDTKLNNKYN